MNINTVISLPVAADLSAAANENASVKLTSTGIDIAGTGDYVIGTLLQGNTFPAVGQSAVGMAADVFLTAGNGLHFVRIGNSTAIAVGDELMQTASGAFAKRATLAVTTTDAGDLFTATAHGLSNGTPLTPTSITTTTGISVGVTYYVVTTAANTFQLAATPGGAAIAITSDGSAVMSQQAMGLAVDSAPASSTDGQIRAILFPRPGASYGAGTSTFTGTGATVLANTPTLITPVIGVATGTSLAATGLLTSSGGTAGIGYATGAGGAVSQATDRTTGVTINKVSGAITTQATSLAAAGEVSFTVTNSTVAVGDTVIACIRSGPTTLGSTQVSVTTVAAGSFQLTLNNLHASVADTGAAIINFAVIKAVSA
jgi:hypothetical protein